MVGSCPQCKQSREQRFKFCPHCGHVIEPAVGHQDDPLIGQTLGNGFVVLELIGAGGMGRVYKAEQRALGRSVAIKIIHAHLVHDPGAASRFVNEAHAASRLNHPHVVSVIDFGRTDQGLPFIVMEHLRGLSLAQVVEREGLLNLARVVDIIGQTLGALNDAHDHGIVHRDLKPANIMLEPTRTGADFVKVLDFGLAQVVAEQSASSPSRREVAGTPAYMSPEQAAGAAVDLRSDLFSVGVILYELATGRRLSHAETAVAAMVERMTSASPGAEELARGRPVPEPFVPVVLKAIAADPAARYPSASEFHGALCEAERRVLGQCGRPTLPAPKSAIACASCGAAVPEKDRFCGACGQRISDRPGEPDATPISAPPMSGMRAGQRTTRLRLNAVGNKSELHKLHEMRLSTESRMRAGRVVGPRGAGKTTLLREFLTMCRATGDSIVEVGADPWGARPACAAFRAALAVLAGVRENDVDHAAARGASPTAQAGLQIAFGKSTPRLLGFSPPEARVALADAFRWAVERGAAGALTGRVVIGVDDLDRIDGPSRNALLDLLLCPPDADVVLVATQSVQAQVDWPKPVDEHMLAGWDCATAQRVLASFGGDVGLPAGFNTRAMVTPLYLEQLIRLHFESKAQPALDTPDLVAQRLDILPPHVRSVLHAVAILGDRARTADLHALLPSETGIEAKLLVLAQAGLVERAGCELLWAHPVIRDVASLAIPAAERRDLSEKASRAFAARDGQLEVLALFARDAEHWFDALFLMEQAASKAASLGDVAGLVHWSWLGYHTVRRAIAAGGLDDPEQAMLAFGRNLGDALLDSGQLGEADAVLREVLEFIGPSSAGYVQILRGLARVRRADSHSGDPAESMNGDVDGANGRRTPQVSSAS